MVAISIPVGEVVGVSDKINPGDRVTVIATFTPGPGGSDVTRILLQNVEVLATSAEIQRTSKKPEIGNASSLGKKTITLAVPPANAEKLVFAEEKGHVWIALMPTSWDGPMMLSLWKHRGRRWNLSLGREDVLNDCLNPGRPG